VHGRVELVIRPIQYLSLVFLVQLVWLPLGAAQHCIHAEKDYRKAVVHIKVEKTHKITGAIDEVEGTGLIVSPRGYLITNNHVVQQDADIDHIDITGAIASRDRLHTTLLPIAHDAQLDLALLQFKDSSEVYQRVQIGDPFSLGPGTRLCSLGFPEEQEFHYSDGTLGGTTAINGWWSTDMPSNRGESGAPVFSDITGKVVAIKVAGYPGAQNLNLLIPINLANTLLLIAGNNGRPDPSAAVGCMPLRSDTTEAGSVQTSEGFDFTWISEWQEAGDEKWFYREVRNNSNKPMNVSWKGTGIEVPALDAHGTSKICRNGPNVRNPQVPVVLRYDDVRRDLSNAKLRWPRHSTSTRVWLSSDDPDPNRRSTRIAPPYDGPDGNSGSVLGYQATFRKAVLVGQGPKESGSDVNPTPFEATWQVNLAMSEPRRYLMFVPLPKKTTHLRIVLKFHSRATPDGRGYKLVNSYENLTPDVKPVVNWSGTDMSVHNQPAGVGVSGFHEGPYELKDEYENLNATTRSVSLRNGTYSPDDSASSQGNDTGQTTTPPRSHQGGPPLKAPRHRISLHLSWLGKHLWPGPRKPDFIEDSDGTKSSPKEQKIYSNDKPVIVPTNVSIRTAIGAVSAMIPYWASSVPN
jgi:S1-C subfamily serine protease